MGRGLGALIRKTGSAPVADPSLPRDGEVVERVALARIVPSPLQPRKHFTEETLDELKESIRQHGIIQPLIVRERHGKLELIAGERRFRAAESLGLAEVPVIHREAGDREVLEMALIENLQREDLDPIEEARAFDRLAREFHLRQEDIASSVGKNRATVANSIRLLDLPADVQGYLAKRLISTGHAKAILALKGAARQTAVAGIVIRKRFTVRETEALVARELAGAGHEPASRRRGADSAVRSLPVHLVAVERRLRAHLATHVTLVHGEKKGRIEIEYYGDDDLSRLVDLLGLADE